MGVFPSLASEPLSGTVSTLTCYYWCLAPQPLLGCSPLVSTWYSGEGSLEKTCPHCREERGYAQTYQNIKELMNSWRVSGKSLRVPWSKGILGWTVGCQLCWLLCHGALEVHLPSRQTSTFQQAKFGFDLTGSTRLYCHNRIWCIQSQCWQYLPFGCE